MTGSVPYAFGLDAGGGLLVGARARTLTALRDGQVAWTADLPGFEPASGVAVGHGYVVTVTAYLDPDAPVRHGD